MSKHGIFERIISGGQTGADQGALDAALELGLPCGGWCPKGRVSEYGPIPDKYPLQEHSSERYRDRTKTNVQDSDGTLAFTYGQTSGDTQLALDFVYQYGKPHFIIDLEFDPVNIDTEKVYAWGQKNKVSILNVVGPREGKYPGTQVITRGIMIEILTHAQRLASDSK